MNQSTAITLVVIFALWILMNISATRHVLKNNDYSHHKTLKVISIWVTPFFGALMILLEKRAEKVASKYASEDEGPLPPGFVNEAAPDELRISESLAFPLFENLGTINGFPFIDWEALETWIAANADENHRQEVTAQAKRAWLLHLKEVLGSHFTLHESADVYVLSSLENRVAMASADYITRAKHRIRQILSDGIARFPDEGKSILLVLDDEESYYDYLSCYYPEQGEFAFSGGIFIKSGCMHFVTKANRLSAMEPVIAHELTHSALAHLDLPTWLDEGLAVNTERLVVGGTQYMSHTAQELRNMHLAFWRDAEIAEFWSGLSFHRPDNGNLLSYELARIMVEQMNRDWASFVQFVLNAQRKDAGAAAAQEFMGIELGAYVSALLEREPRPEWSPIPSVSVI
jgi:hypothetical protein